MPPRSRSVLFLAAALTCAGESGLSPRDAQQFESARTVSLQFGDDIPGRGIFADDVRKVTRALALAEVPDAEGDLRLHVKGHVYYNHRTWNAEGAAGRLLTTRIRAEGTIAARLEPKGPELTAEFSCDSGMPLAPALVESPSDIDPPPSVEEVSQCVARNVKQLLSPVLKREPRPDDVRDRLALVLDGRAAPRIARRGRPDR